MLLSRVNGGPAVFRLGTHLQAFFGCKEPAECLAGFRAVIGNQDSLPHRAQPFMHTSRILQKQNCSVEYLLYARRRVQANIWRGLAFVQPQAREIVGA